MANKVTKEEARKVLREAKAKRNQKIKDTGGQIKKSAQKVGSYTIAPYLLKSLGFDKAADAVGYPFDDKGEMREGFKNGGQVQGTKFKGTF
jgi:hypothetical protein|tara:strand:- start:171 stop:443 length:273 start_codon:yes stop_codon:yes gene_type:complete